MTACAQRNLLVHVGLNLHCIATVPRLQLKTQCLHPLMLVHAVKEQREAVPAVWAANVTATVTAKSTLPTQSKCILV